MDSVVFFPGAQFALLSTANISIHASQLIAREFTLARMRHLETAAPAGKNAGENSVTTRTDKSVLPVPSEVLTSEDILRAPASIKVGSRRLQLFVRRYEDQGVVPVSFRCIVVV
ncbi:unnamed protein product [Protopolystoma xenopodis]|uniref:Uncharacterized protein n=1 Tax=Protopolystoma xenopodis TaxID=117903 RepID=A0A3S5CVQ6_9PLAT|nr:unnamed protein product [Protopolystoma xenopodis]